MRCIKHERTSCYLSQSVLCLQATCYNSMCEDLQRCLSGLISEPYRPEYSRVNIIESKRGPVHDLDLDVEDLADDINMNSLEPV